MKYGSPVLRKRDHTALHVPVGPERIAVCFSFSLGVGLMPGVSVRYLSSLQEPWGRQMRRLWAPDTQ